MIKRTLTGAMILIFTVGFLVLKQFSPLFFDAFALIIMYVSLIETLIIYGFPKKNNYGIILLFVPAIIFVLFALNLDYFSIACYILLCALIILMLSLTFDIIAYAKKRKIETSETDPEKLNASLFSKTKQIMQTLAYPILPLTFLFALNHLDYNLSYVGLILVFAVSMTTDTFAYLFGMAFGKHKFIPEVSPKKTIEGVFGGAFGGLLSAGICFVIFYFANFFEFQTIASLWKLILSFSLIGIIGSYINQLGDLIESAFKRKAGVKDSSHIFPGHGGMLDRVDGQMFTACFIFLIFAIIIV